MSLAQSEITLPFSWLSDHVWSSGSLQAVCSYHTALGRYNPYMFLMHARPLEAPADASGRIEINAFLDYLETKVRKVKSADARLQLLLRETTWLHEVRHFHDCMCTPAGFRGFLTYVIYVSMIVEGLVDLQKSGRCLSAPLKAFAFGEERGDKLIGRIADLYYSLLLFQVFFNGDLPQHLDDMSLTNSEVVWIRLAEAPFDVPLLPAFSATAQLDDGERICLITPLGFRALTESAARMVQNHVIRSFGQELVDRYGVLLRAYPEYGTANRFLTRAMKNRGLIEAIEARQEGEKELYRFVHAALHTFGDQAPTGFSGLPGARFVEVIEQELGRESNARQDQETLRATAVSYFQGVLSQKDYASSRYFADRVIEFGARCLTRSMEVYKDRELSSMFSADTLEGYIVFGARLPQPPLSLDEKRGVGYNWLDIEYTIERFLPALVPWIFLLKALDDMWTGETVRCPVIYGEERTLFADPTIRPDPNCVSATPGGPCGSVALGGSLAGHCDCPWKRCMLDWAVARAD